MKISLLTILILSVTAGYAQADEKKEIKTQVKVSKNISIGKVTPPQKDSRTHTEKEIKEHRESNAGKSTVGVTIEY